jgi:hypothetical protein
LARRGTARFGVARVLNSESEWEGTMKKFVSVSSVLALWLLFCSAGFGQDEPDAMFFAGSKIWMRFDKDSEIKMSPDEVAELAFFEGFVTGISELGNGTFFKPKGEIKMAVLFSTVARYIEKHPEDAKQGKLVVSVVALVQEFPLEEKPKPKLKQVPEKELV